MVKITLKYPNLPELTIDSNVSECVQILRALSLEKTAPPLHAETRSVPVDQPRVAAPGPVAATPAGPAASRDRDHGETRLYGGKRNRRDMILEVFRDLHDEGRETLGLDLIRTRFEDKFPEEDQQHLDQVIRDLANKTGLVTREGRGRFRLVS